MKINLSYFTNVSRQIFTFNKKEIVLMMLSVYGPTCQNVA